MMRQFIPTLSGSDKPCMHFVDQITTIDFAVLPASLFATKWKQFALGKNAFYEAVKHNHCMQAFVSSSSSHLVVAPKMQLSKNNLQSPMYNYLLFPPFKLLVVGLA